MTRCFSYLRFAFAFLAIGFALSSATFADNTRERTQFGHDINIAPDEEVGEVTCFGCNVRVRGHVSSDVTLFGGSLIVEDQGEVAGDAAVFGGGVRLDKNAKVNGDLSVFGGQIRRDPEASVGGDITNFRGSIWVFVIFGLPFVILAALVALIVWVIRRLTRPSVPATA